MHQLRDPGDLDRTDLYRVVDRIQNVLFVNEPDRPVREWDAATVDEVAKVLAEYGLAPTDYE
jgi:hypothetical protein